MSAYDVVVVGAGNAAMCAALAAREHGVKVAVLEWAAFGDHGGNSAFTAGAIRTVYNGVDDLRAIMPDLTESEIANTDFGTYTEDSSSTTWRASRRAAPIPDLCELLVKRSHPTLKWMTTKGVRFAPIYGRQAFKIDGKFKFWGGLTVESVGGGPGLVEALHKSAAREGIDIMYQTRARVAARRRQGRARRARRAEGRDQGDSRQGRGPRRRRLPGQRRVAHALSRADLGSRKGARLALQHGRRHPHGDGGRRASGRQLVGLPRGRLGSQRAGIRRSRRRRRLPEALLSVRHHGQRRRRALRRRGRRLPQLHLRQIRPGHPQPAGPVRLADLRPEGRAPAARRISHPPGHQGAGRHAGRALDQARGRQSAGAS